MNLLRLLRIVFVLVVSWILTGCGTVHGWGQKSAGAPASFGGGINLPLGK
jgi:predicted small secreted protein